MKQLFTGKLAEEGRAMGIDIDGLNREGELITKAMNEAKRRMQVKRGKIKHFFIYHWYNGFLIPSLGEKDYEYDKEVDKVLTEWGYYK